MRLLLVLATMLFSIQPALACKMSESHRAIIMFDEALKVLKDGNLYNGQTITQMKIDGSDVNIYATDNSTGECSLTKVLVRIHPDCSVTSKPTAGVYTCEEAK